MKVVSLCSGFGNSNILDKTLRFGFTSVGHNEMKGNIYLFKKSLFKMLTLVPKLIEFLMFFPHTYTFVLVGSK